MDKEQDKMDWFDGEEAQELKGTTTSDVVPGKGYTTFEIEPFVPDYVLNNTESPDSRIKWKLHTNDSLHLATYDENIEGQLDKELREIISDVRETSRLSMAQRGSSTRDEEFDKVWGIK